MAGRLKGARKQRCERLSQGWVEVGKHVLPASITAMNEGIHSIFYRPLGDT
jgi:hypothetical protein